MSITLVTGAPGTGKTAHAVDLIQTEYKGRPVFQMGIRDLTVEHSPVPPVSEWTEEKASPEDPEHVQFWFTFPPNSVVIVDEAQTVFRPRPIGSRVPPEVQAFETHRHLGIDFVLLTQHPGLIDSNIRKLVGRHRHIRHTAFGRHMFEWTETGDPESTSSRAIAAKSRYKLPREVFGRYKSAELHTRSKTRMPWYFYIFLIASLIAVVAGVRAYQSFAGKVGGTAVASVPGGSPGAPGAAGPAVALSYAEKEKPRVAGLLHTAPKYDEITKATDAPWPAGCILVGAWRGASEKCRCVDQQGNAYATTDAMCRHVVAHGLFKDWGKRDSPPDAPQAQQAARRAPPVSDLPERDVADSGPSGRV